MIYVTARIDLALAAGRAGRRAGALRPHAGRTGAVCAARYQEVKNLESSALAVVQEVLTALRVVKAFGQEDREERRFVARVRGKACERGSGSLLIDERRSGVAIGLVTALGTAAVLFVGVRSVESGAITLGSLLLVMAYLAAALRAARAR